MEKQQIFELLQEMGYMVSFDEEGDIMITYQMKQIFLLISSDNDNFVSLMLPQFYSIDDDEETLVLAACNKATRGVKMAKVYVDHTFKNVSASCEFFYTDEDCLRQNIVHSMSIIGVIHSIFHETLLDMRDDLDSDD